MPQHYSDAETGQSWAEFLKQINELHLSRAEACRKAGVSDSTFFKGLKAEKAFAEGQLAKAPRGPSLRLRGRLTRMLQTERQMQKLGNAIQQQLGEGER